MCSVTDMATTTEQMAQAIKEQMQMRHWTLVDLSAASGIPPKRLTERLTGLTEFQLSELSKLATAFGFTLVELIGMVVQDESTPQKLAA